LREFPEVRLFPPNERLALWNPSWNVIVMPDASRAKTRVLLIEDDDDDFSLTSDMLAEVPGHYYELEWARSYETGLKEIDSGAHEACLLDNLLGTHTGLELLHACGGVNAPLPIIMLTGIHDRGIGQAVMEAGASDYLMKGQLNPTLLERAIRYATERHRMRGELEQLAKYDPLTGLANRKLFLDFLSGAIARSQRSQHGLALMFLDLDHFKDVNDTHGHDIGDALLVEVGRRLKACVRTGDLVVRLGGDEFAIVLDDVGNTDSIVSIAQNILNALRPPCALAGQAVRAGMSIGVALFPTDADTPSELIKAADSAMYDAKRHGRDTYRLFATRRQKAAQAASTIERSLAGDIAADNVLAHY
jgi:diguanylate cyclase (GGDEF)-like protein